MVRVSILLKTLPTEDCGRMINFMEMDKFCCLMDQKGKEYLRMAKRMEYLLIQISMVRWKNIYGKMECKLKRLMRVVLNGIFPTMSIVEGPVGIRC